MMFPNKNNQVRSLRYGIGNQDLPKTNLVNALRYGTQLGSDFLTGSSISEALGYRPDVIKGQGYTPSYRDQFNTTVDLLRQGKTTEGLVKGAETLLTGTGAVGEGMMVASVLTGPLASIMLGAGLALKGVSKGGKLIFKTKTGKEVLANFKRANTPQGEVKLDVKNIEIPKNDKSDEIKALEDNIDIPTYKTDVKEQIKGYKAKKIFSDAEGTGYDYRGFQIRSFEDTFNPSKKNYSISEYDEDGNVLESFDAQNSFQDAKARIDELLERDNPNLAERALLKDEEYK